MSYYTVKDLRQAGFKVRVLHYRYTKGDKIYPLGGHTQIQVTTPHGEEFQETTKCHPQDNYNKKLGVSIALGRLTNQEGWIKYTNTCRLTEEEKQQIRKEKGLTY